jgi:hypothetical protein
MNVAMGPPVPGMIPMIVPMMDARLNVPKSPRISLQLGSNALSFGLNASAAWEPLATRSSSTWGMAKIPIIAGIIETPWVRATWPNVKRCVPSSGSSPTVTSMRPRRPEMIPLTNEC